MKMQIRRPHWQSLHGFSLTELLIASTAFTVVMGAIAMSFVSFNRCFTLAKDYASARLTLSDYLNMDLRRSTLFEPTIVPNVTVGNWKVSEWRLPMAMMVPSYYASVGSGVTNPPGRKTLTVAEWEEKKVAALARGKMPPPKWTVTYGATSGRVIVYEQAGDLVQRREGLGTINRDALTGALSWTWSNGTPLPVDLARGVVQIRGVYSVTQDLTPTDMSEPPPEDVMETFRGNYTIRYAPSARSKVNSQPATLITNNVLLRCQYYGL